MKGVEAPLPAEFVMQISLCLRARVKLTTKIILRAIMFN